MRKLEKREGSPGVGEEEEAGRVAVVEAADVDDMMTDEPTPLTLAFDERVCGDLPGR